LHLFSLLMFVRGELEGDVDNLPELLTMFRSVTRHKELVVCSISGATPVNIDELSLFQPARETVFFEFAYEPPTGVVSILGSTAPSLQHYTQPPQSRCTESDAYWGYIPHERRAKSREYAGLGNE
jgi:hypothetical protein